jgi:hypothetical protein
VPSRPGCRAGRPRPTDVGRPGRIAGLADHGRPIAPGEPANLVLVDPTRWTVDRDASSRCPATTPGTAQPPGPSSRRSLRGRVRPRAEGAIPVMLTQAASPPSWSSRTAARSPAGPSAPSGRPSARPSSPPA